MFDRPYFFQYDIPKPAGRDVYPNPSTDLWLARCVRITQSCWLVMESNLPRIYLLKNEMVEAGCRVYTIPFDVSGADDLRAMALDNIRREITERLAEAETTRAEAQTRFDDESNSDYKARRRRYLAAALSIEKRVTERLALIAPAAATFGITADMIFVGSAAESVTLIAANMRERAAAFARAHGILSRMPGEGAGVARMMRRGEIPTGVAADWLQDQDGEENTKAAEELRDSFSGTSF